MRNFKKSISAFMVLLLLLLILPQIFLSNIQVEADGNEPNIIKFMDVRIDAFRNTSYATPDMGNIGNVTVDIPGMTLKNIRWNVITKLIDFDIVPDTTAVMRSQGGSYWDDMQRTRYISIDTYLYKNNTQRFSKSLSWRLVEGPNVTTSNTAVFNLSKQFVTSMNDNPSDIGIPDKIAFSFAAYDAQHEAGEYANGWHNGMQWYVEKPLVSNSAPVLTIATPDNQLFNENSMLIPISSVSDANGDRLELKYYIDSEAEPRETKAVTNTATAQTISFSPVNISSLPEGNHTVRFTANDGNETAQSSITIVVDKSNPSLGNVNITSSDSQIQLAGTASDPISGLDSLPYRYTVGERTSGWIANPSFTAAGLTPNTSFHTKFEAKDRVGHIAVKEQNVYTQAQIPTLSVQQNGETSLKILLNDQNSAQTPYLIQTGSSYVTSTGGLTNSPVWFTTSSKTILLNGLTANTTYTFQAKSKNNDGIETGFGASTNGTTLALAPSGVTAEASQQWIKLVWPSSLNALGYDVEADGLIINNGNSNTFVHNGLSANTQHTYKIRVRNAGGTSSWSQPLTKLTLPDPPAIPVQLLTVPTQRFITLSWDLVAKATRYEVEADGNIVDNGNSNTFLHQSLEPLTDHTYRVRASNPGGTSEWSNSVLQQTWPNPPDTPTKLSGVPDIHTVTVKWDEMERAIGYEIEVDGLIMDNKNVASFIHGDLDALSGHTYRVRATNIGGKSPWSVPLDITTHPEIPDIPTNIMTTSNEAEITAIWYTVPNTDSYDIQIDGSAVVNVTDNSFVHDQLTVNTVHTYRIRAKNISGDSDWSKLVTMATMPEAKNTASLTNIVAVVTNKAITLSWDTVAPEARYDIEVDGKLLDNAADTIYNHTGLNAEEYHIYKIRVKQGNETGDWVAVLALSTLSNLPDAPSKIDAFAQNTSIELHWQKLEGASGYQLEIDGKTIDIANDTSYIHNDLTSGTAHTYRVRAKNATGVTAWSPSLQKSTTSPDYVIQVKQDEECSLTLLAQNVQDFSELIFVVTYDPNELELADLYDFTPDQDLSSGEIAASNLTATYSAGKITFTINQNIVPGTSWSGEITTLLFNSKKNGEASVHVAVD